MQRNFIILSIFTLNLTGRSIFKDILLNAFCIITINFILMLNLIEAGIFTGWYIHRLVYPPLTKNISSSRKTFRESQLSRMNLSYFQIAYFRFLNKFVILNQEIILFRNTLKIIKWFRKEDFLLNHNIFCKRTDLDYKEYS